MNAERAEIVLKLGGFRVRLFTDPELALRSLEIDSEKPALMLASFLMHPTNGLELIKRCKEIQPNLKAVLFSGNVGEEILQYYSVEPDAFMGKPFLAETLLRTIKSVLEPV